MPDVIENGASLPDVDVSEIMVDGVQVLHFPDRTGLTEATLIFGVGERDETLATIGTLHALEHAVMSGVRRTPIDINGAVSASTTQFMATGSADLVSAFLTGVCRGLSSPPVDRLSEEARVLEAEGDGEILPSCPPAAVIRYGFRGLGVIGGPGPGPTGVRPADVRRMASTWFVAANALLVIEGDLPSGLRLPLSDGPRPVRAAIFPRPLGHPAVVAVDGPLCELNLVAPAEPATLTRLAITVLDDRLTEVLRHDLGLVYSIDISPIRVPGGFDVTVRTDPTPGRAGACLQALVTTVRALIDDVPTPEEVAHAKAVVVESLHGRDAAIGRLVESAVETMIDLPTGVIRLDDLAKYGPDDVTAHLRLSGDDLIYVVGDGVDVDPASLDLEELEVSPSTERDLPAGEVFRPPLIALALNRDARALRVVLTEEGLAQGFGGKVQQLRWADVVGAVKVEDGDILVFGKSGQAIPVGPSLFKNGQRLIDAVLSNVPGDLIYEAPPDVDVAIDEPGASASAER